MSVYRDTAATVVFEHPHEGPLTAVVYRDDETTPVVASQTITKTEGQFRLALPWQATEFDAKLTVVWTATDFERRQQVEVVSPLVSLARLRTLFPGESKTDPELAELEQTVRVFIQAYCGQTFGYAKGTKTVETRNGRHVLANTRSAKLLSVANDTGMTLYASIDGFTLYVQPAPAFVPGDADEVATLVNGYSHVIYAPGMDPRVVKDGTFTVTGIWGWEAVPAEVQEAAMLLANDFSCSESIYRDRYLESVKIQQDTITYHPGAFRGTGNARADLLLAKHRRPGMVII